MRREKRVPMSIFTKYVILLSRRIDAECFQNIAEHNYIGEVTYSASEFKRRVASQIVEPYLDLEMRKTELTQNK